MDEHTRQVIKEDAKQQVLELYGLGGVNLTRENILSHLGTHPGYAVEGDEVDSDGNLIVDLIPRQHGLGRSRKLRFRPLGDDTYDFITVEDKA